MEQTGKNLNDLRKDDDGECQSKQLAPHGDPQGYGAKERTGKLDDQHLQHKGAAHDQQHQLVLKQVAKDTLAVQFPAVKGVKQLKQHKQGEQHGGHLAPGSTQEIQLVLQQEHSAHIHAGGGDPRQHTLGDNIFAAVGGAAAHQVTVSRLQSQGQGRRTVHNNVDPQQLQGGKGRRQPHQNRHKYANNRGNIHRQLKADEPLKPH